MKKNFRDQVLAAIAKKHIAAYTDPFKPHPGTGDVDLIMAEVAFRYFWGKDLRKSVIWSNAVSYAYTGIVYVAGRKFMAQGNTKKSVLLRLAQQFNSTVPIYTANGSEIPKEVPDGE